MWLKDPQSGALHLIAAITTVYPLEIKGDRNDQRKVTEVHTRLTMAGGDVHHTTIPFDEAIAVLNPAPKPIPPQNTTGA